MFAENVGSVVPLLKTLTRKIIQGHDMEDLKTVSRIDNTYAYMRDTHTHTMKHTRKQAP